MLSRSFRRIVASLTQISLRRVRPAVVSGKTFRPGLESLESRLAPAVDMWTGTVDNNWSTPGNWALGHAPGTTDVAQFTSNSNVHSTTSVVNLNYSIAGIQIDGSWGGTINVPAVLTLAASSVSEFDSGSLNPGVNGGSVVNNGTLTLKNTSDVVLGGGGTFTNNGVINQTGTGALNMGASSGIATTLKNTSTGVYNFQNDGSLIGGGNGVVVNAGTIKKAAGTGTSLITPPLTNTATINVATGTLGFQGNTNSTGGTFTTSTGATLDLTGGNVFATYTQTGTFTATGSGKVLFATGTLGIGTAGATFNIPSTVSMQWAGGNMNIPTNATLTYVGLLTLTNSNSVNLQGGGTFNNTGTINQQGAGGLNLAGNPTTFKNASVYNILSDSNIDGGSNGSFINTGTINKSAGTATSKIAVPLSNSGTINANSGTLGLQSNTTSTNGTYGTTTGATLDLTGGNVFATFTESGTFTASGTGTVNLNSGTLAIGPSGATFNVASTASFAWSGGTIAIPLNATLTSNNTVNLVNTTSSNLTLQGPGTFLNKGTINQKGAGTLGLNTTLNNAVGAIYNFQNNSKITSSGGVFINAGLIEKTAGTGTAIINPALSNSGTLNVATGVLQLANNSSNTGGTYTVAAGATLDLTGGSTFSETGTFTATGAGTITIGTGTFAVYNNAATLNIPAGLTFLWPGSSINVPASNALTINGNVILNGSSNEVILGGGTVTANGTLTQSGTGNLALNVTNGSASTLNLSSTAIYNITTNSSVTSSQGILHNAGTIKKSGGTSVSSIGSIFNNSGTLAVSTGTLKLSTAGGENTGGVFSVSAGAILDLTGGNTVSYSGTYTGSGAGEVLVSNGTLKLTGGTNPATFNLPGGLFVWSGGTINTANGSMVVLGTLNITTPSGTETLTGGGSLTIGSATAAGTINDLTAGNILKVDTQTTLKIAALGVFNISDSTINGSGALSNLGVFRKSTGTSGATVALATDNQGKVEVDNGTLVFSGAVNQIFGGALTGGTWNVVSSATVSSVLSITSASFATIGIGANVSLNGPNSTFNNLAGLGVNNGGFSLLGGALFTTLAGFSNTGTLTLGPASVLTVKGNFTQSSTGKTIAQIGGPASGPTYGRLTATGTVTLNGTLAVTGTILPAVGANLQIITNSGAAPIQGTYSNLAEGATFQVTVNGVTSTWKITYHGGSGSKNVIITRLS